ncbi:MAG: HAD-IIB family hydrolase [Leptolyngbya sp. IPPAS B-1204]|nr:MAG: HAD family phosphatase [Leptolyngbya sp. IPPAS B-1204]
MTFTQSWQPLQPLTSAALQSVRLIATDMDGTLTQAEKFTPLLLQTLSELAEASIPVLIVTGRSAGWVSAIVHYLPVAGAIAENGGLYYSRDEVAISLSDISNRVEHRQKLAQMFADLQREFPKIQESTDNPFRITDWTFDVQGLSLRELQHMQSRCHQQGWGFTYSTVQCHIKPLQQEKAIGLQTVLNRYFPQLTPVEVITVGDSPNDQSLFDPNYFPVSVGVANLQHYVDQLTHLPAYLTQKAEVAGFCELVSYMKSHEKRRSNERLH